MAESEHPDKERLDWFDSKRTGAGWVCRLSVTTLGWFIHESDSEVHRNIPVETTVRDAIDAAMAREKGGG